MTWDQLAEFIAALPAAERAKEMRVKPDPVQEILKELPPVMLVSCAIPDLPNLDGPAMFVYWPGT